MTRFLVRSALALGVATAIAACGGGGGGGDAGPVADGGTGTPGGGTPNAISESALDSWGTMLAFLKTFTASEDGEPWTIPKAAPADDAAEPSPLT